MAKFTVPSNDGQSRQNQEIRSDHRVRIYEISKELNLDNKDVLAIAEELKLSGVTSHSSTISDEEAALIRQAVQKNFRRKSVRVNASAAPATISATVKSAERRSLTLRRTPRIAQGFVEPLLAVGEALPLHMVLVPGGTFLMGQTEAEKAELICQVGEEDYQKFYRRELPQHEVTVPSFFMGRYPVTQTQWRAVAALPQIKREIKPDPSGFKGDNCPVERVSWYDAVEFCARLSVHAGRPYHLPTEAEWEYACRAGTTTPFYFGTTLTTDVANYNGNYTYADGPEGEDRNETTPVDHFGVANAFGLCNMHGNVYEWCQDHLHTDYEGAPTDGRAWIEGRDSDLRIIRGGSWIDNPRDCRSAYRFFTVPGYTNDYDVGFRVVCATPRALQPSTV